MNESIMWAIATFVAGCICGGALMGWYTGKKAAVEIDKLIDENNRLAAEKTVAVTKREAALNIAEKRYEPTIESLRKERKTHRDYTKMYGDPNQDAERDPEPMETIEEELAKTIAPGDDPELRAPFLISAEDFENDAHDSDTVTLSFYKEDGVLADDRDEMVEDPLDKVGEDGLEKLRETAEDVLYFHSDTYDANYEVIVLHGMCYRHTVLGQTDGPINPEGENQSDTEEEDDDGEELAMQTMTGRSRRGWE